VWGILAWRGLQALGLRPYVLSSREVAQGVLHKLTPQWLIVPGGWARKKSHALGPLGRQAIRDYVASGGQYLGICGGAGLALHEKGQLHLCALQRKPAHQRLPNCSGHIHCMVSLPGSPPQRAPLPVWWPSQFQEPGNAMETVASYLEPDRDFWVADLPLSDIPEADIPAWESLYGINLHPQWIQGDPCIVRGIYGHGQIVLSYAHLETPQSPEANALLAQILGHPPASVPQWDLCQPSVRWPDATIQRMYDALMEVVMVGQRHFLLTWRTPWLLGWRRGILASPITTLLAMTTQIQSLPPNANSCAWWEKHDQECWQLWARFCQQTISYFIAERRTLAYSSQLPEQGNSLEHQAMCRELFGPFPGYGGLYGQILQLVDEVVFRLLRGDGNMPNFL